jgi:hypothetical protein
VLQNQEREYADTFGWDGNCSGQNDMSRALFCVLPRTAALPKIGKQLKDAGISSHSISTLSFDSPPPHREMIQTQSRELRATGQLKWAIQGASSTGATRRVARALAGMGMPEASALRYQDLVRMGNTLLCVFCETLGQAQQALSVLRGAGVQELATTGAAIGSPRIH